MALRPLLSTKNIGNLYDGTILTNSKTLLAATYSRKIRYGKHPTSAFGYLWSNGGEKTPSQLTGEGTTEVLAGTVGGALPKGEGSRNPPGALVWGPAGAMATRDGRERRAAGRQNSVGKGRIVRALGTCSPGCFPNYSCSKGSQKEPQMHTSKS